MSYKQMTNDERRAELLSDPPPWHYNPDTGALTGKRGQPVTQTQYRGIHYNKKAIRVWFATGYYPDRVWPTMPNARPLPDGKMEGGPKDYRLVNLKYEYEHQKTTP
jgi:hypothetical protein